MSNKFRCVFFFVFFFANNFSTQPIVSTIPPQATCSNIMDHSRIRIIIIKVATMYTGTMICVSIISNVTLGITITDNKTTVRFIGRMISMATDQMIITGSNDTVL